MIEPDQKEVMWYDLNNLINAEPDTYPHYWEVLSSKHLELEHSLIQDYKNEDITIVGFCMTCGTCDVFEFKDKMYCEYDFDFKQELNKKTKVDEIVEIKKKFISEDHGVVKMNSVQLVKTIINRVIDMLEETDGSKMNLYELESYMLGHDDSEIFDTRYGFVTKGEVKKRLHKIKDFLVYRLSEVRPYIRFSSQMRTPSISVN